MLNDLQVQDYWYHSHHGTTIPAPEWADCMYFAVNKIYNDKIVWYEGTLTIDKIQADLESGVPVYTSMKYPGNKNFSGKPSPIGGHIVLIVGIDNNSIIINDPYKNHLTGDKDGFRNFYTFEKFERHNKGYAIRYKKIHGRQ